jgi:uncharacterized protein Smg (DUF494 family)
MALSGDRDSIDQLKVIPLIVLWSKQHSIDSLIVEGLLSDGAQSLMR